MRFGERRVKLVSLAVALFILIFTAVVLMYIFWTDPPSSPPSNVRPVLVKEIEYPELIIG